MEDNSEQYFFAWAENLVDKIITKEKDSHGDEGLVYGLSTEKGEYFLKIEFNSTSTSEYDKLKWFQGKIPVPEVLGFVIHDNSKALLTKKVEGQNLAVLSKVWTAEKVIDKLVSALHRLHSTEINGWPFGGKGHGKVMVHGDACLPNFIFNNNELTGYIDLGAAHIDNPEVDLAAAIWSLQYNLGVGHGAQFLQRYGHDDPTEDVAEKLRLEYENYQRANGFL